MYCPELLGHKAWGRVWEGQNEALRDRSTARTTRPTARRGAQGHGPWARALHGHLGLGLRRGRTQPWGRASSLAAWHTKQLSAWLAFDAG